MGGEKEKQFNMSCGLFMDKETRKWLTEAMKSVMWAGIKLCINRKDEREEGKETPKKEIDKRRIFMTLHITLPALPLTYSIMN